MRTLGIRCDERALVRGALLHDYYLYDWHDHNAAPDAWHGFTHPRHALRNAEADFPDLTPLERDIIAHHMFPLVPSPPRHVEALVVSLVDKACSTVEVFARRPWATTSEEAPHARAHCGGNCRALHHERARPHAMGHLDSHALDDNDIRGRVGLGDRVLLDCGERRPVRRGFLFGPACPIYGTGAVAVYVLLGHLESPLAVFAAGSVLATAIEYATGRALEKRFGRRWWDYTGWPLNYRGLVCPIASAVFGVFSVLVVFAIEPQLIAFFSSWGEAACEAAATACALTFAADTALSVVAQDKGAGRWRITLRR